MCIDELRQEGCSIL